MTWTPTPGIHENVPEAEYHADRTAVSNSWLGHIARTPMHLRHYLDSEPSPQTPSMLLGSVVHTLVLEPELYESRYIVAPTVDRRTRAGKAEYAEFLERAEGLTVISSDVAANAHRAARHVLDHPSVGEIVAQSEARELTLVWEDSGVLCKARADLQTPDGLADLKTTSSAMPGDFAHSAHRYRYHVQRAHYMAGARALGLPTDDFLFLCVEPSAPFPVAVYRLDEDFTRLGEEMRERDLDTYRVCQETGHWPGYPENVIELSAPGWALREVA